MWQITLIRPEWRLQLWFYAERECWRPAEKHVGRLRAMLFQELQFFFFKQGFIWGPSNPLTIWNKTICPGGPIREKEHLIMTWHNKLRYTVLQEGDLKGRFTQTIYNVDSFSFVISLVQSSSKREMVDFFFWVCCRKLRKSGHLRASQQESLSTLIAKKIEKAIWHTFQKLTFFHHRWKI